MNGQCSFIDPKCEWASIIIPLYPILPVNIHGHGMGWWNQPTSSHVTHHERRVYFSVYYTNMSHLSDRPFAQGFYQPGLKLMTLDLRALLGLPGHWVTIEGKCVKPCLLSGKVKVHACFVCGTIDFLLVRDATSLIACEEMIYMK